MSKQLEDLASKLTQQTDVIQGASQLMSSLSQQLRDAKDDPAKIAQLAADLDRNTAALAAAIAANTPADPNAQPSPDTTA